MKERYQLLIVCLLGVTIGFAIIGIAALAGIGP